MSSDGVSYTSRGLRGFALISLIFLPVAIFAWSLAGMNPMLWALLSTYFWVLVYLESAMIAGRLPYSKHVNDLNAPLARRKWFWFVSDLLCTMFGLAFVLFVGMALME